jgi:hypothetical protein
MILVEILKPWVLERGPRRASELPGPPGGYRAAVSISVEECCERRESAAAAVSGVEKAVPVPKEAPPRMMAGVLRAAMVMGNMLWGGNWWRRGYGLRLKMEMEIAGWRDRVIVVIKGCGYWLVRPRWLGWLSEEVEG